MGEYYTRLTKVSELTWDETAEEKAVSKASSLLTSVRNKIDAYRAAPGMQGETARAALSWLDAFAKDVAARAEVLRIITAHHNRALAAITQAKTEFSGLATELVSRFESEYFSRLDTVTLPDGTEMTGEAYVIRLAAEREKAREAASLRILNTMNIAVSSEANSILDYVPPETEAPGDGSDGSGGGGGGKPPMGPGQGDDYTRPPSVPPLGQWPIVPPVDGGPTDPSLPSDPDLPPPPDDPITPSPPDDPITPRPPDGPPAPDVPHPPDPHDPLPPPGNLPPGDDVPPAPDTPPWLVPPRDGGPPGQPPGPWDLPPSPDLPEGYRPPDVLDPDDPRWSPNYRPPGFSAPETGIVGGMVGVGGGLAAKSLLAGPSAVAVNAAAGSGSVGTMGAYGVAMGASPVSQAARAPRGGMLSRAGALGSQAVGPVPGQRDDKKKRRPERPGLVGYEVERLDEGTGTPVPAPDAAGAGSAAGLKPIRGEDDERW